MTRFEKYKELLNYINENNEYLKLHFEYTAYLLLQYTTPGKKLWFYDTLRRCPLRFVYLAINKLTDNIKCFLVNS